MPHSLLWVVEKALPVFGDGFMGIHQIKKLIETGLPLSVRVLSQ